MMSSLLCWQSSVGAIEPVPTGDSWFYYDIGGARSINSPASLHSTNIDISASAGISGLSCAGFDPKLSLTNSLNSIKNGVDDAMTQMEAAATAAIALLPGYLLQKANPGLYDLFQNGILRAQESFSLATKSCEAMQDQLNRDIDPFEEWITLSKGDTWKAAVGQGGIDIESTKKQVAARGGDQGVVWVNGKRAGGVGQVEINLIQDTTKAGYNLLTGRLVTDNSALVVSSDHANVARIWDSPAKAQAWAKESLGELTIRTCTGCKKGGTPGKGLLNHVSQRKKTIENKLTSLVNSNAPLTYEKLEAIRAPGIAVTAQVIEAIRNAGPESKAVIAGKLSGELAQAQVMEEALMMRRILLAGRREGNIVQNKLAQKELSDAIAELDEEIENLLFEKRVRRELVSDTVAKLLTSDAHRRIASRAIAPVQEVNPRLFERGRVKP